MRKAYLGLFHHDRKCPNCNTWISQAGGVEKFSVDEHYFEYMTCRQCDYTSKWINHGITCESVGKVDKGFKNVHPKRSEEAENVRNEREEK